MKFDFPKDFAWGTATASYQIEGAVKQDGRGETIWDRFCQTPGNIRHGDTGDIACDHYNRYREDVALMKELGHTSYRFSVCWSRIMPSGRGKINESGIRFYENLVDELLANGIEPYLTIYHWDLPQALQDIGGWQNEAMIVYFEAYCRVLYERLGGKVKKWITINEPFCTAFVGNYFGEHAPGMHDFSTALRVSYILLQAHGAAVRLFRKLGVKGEIGISLNGAHTKPYSQSPQDIQAARRQDGFEFRWFFDPVLKGSFPRDMVQWYTDKGLSLPRLDEEASICEPLDFIGVNYYAVNYIRNNGARWPLCLESATMDLPKSDRNWNIVADGLRELLLRLKNEYGVQNVYITENGVAYNDVVGLDGQIMDYNRIDYIRRHLIAAHQAMNEGVNLRGYFVWSLYDNFEWAYGRYSRFGIVWMDFENQNRHPKQSAYWYRQTINDKGFDA